MPRKRSPGTVSVEDAAELLGFDAQTLRLILQTGEYPEIGGIAKKTGPDREAYNYEISKFQLFQHLGYDVRLSIEETLARVRAGDPPWIYQEKVLAWRKIFGEQKEKTFLESLAAEGTS